MQTFVVRAPGDLITRRTIEIEEIATGKLLKIHQVPPNSNMQVNSGGEKKTLGPGKWVYSDSESFLIREFDINRLTGSNSVPKDYNISEKGKKLILEIRKLQARSRLLACTGEIITIVDPKSGENRDINIIPMDSPNAFLASINSQIYGFDFSQSFSLSQDLSKSAKVKITNNLIRILVEKDIREKTREFDPSERNALALLTELIDNIETADRNKLWESENRLIALDLILNSDMDVKYEDLLKINKFLSDEDYPKFLKLISSNNKFKSALGSEILRLSNLPTREDVFENINLFSQSARRDIDTYLEQHGILEDFLKYKSRRLLIPERLIRIAEEQELKDIIKMLLKNEIYTNDQGKSIIEERAASIKDPELFLDIEKYLCKKIKSNPIFPTTITLKSDGPIISREDFSKHISFESLFIDKGDHIEILAISPLIKPLSLKIIKGSCSILVNDSIAAHFYIFDKNYILLASEDVKLERISIKTGLFKSESGSLTILDFDLEFLISKNKLPSDKVKLVVTDNGNCYVENKTWHSTKWIPVNINVSSYAKKVARELSTVR